ncbi:sporulation histidine kinase inhibitor Sda [Jeotgalibacillus haloalkalitolerans]|uniref:Sporulation histidine kinase inhibitor Sda n=1 Tax=Jeotgalibacillus haloalkalitolerans TaxID=3104292 RepID=A0ABU5KM10_9BACL|nr:sporulation histidine kinase inhibitor Sda [Jeotgalibacillus sp. HH7-29]MDZ5712299.1 sporulation histidine kinase inhibitor Sda [Jeotgalibacillus sp. HH7-29]
MDKLSLEALEKAYEAAKKQKLSDDFLQLLEMEILKKEK